MTKEFLLSLSQRISEQILELEKTKLNEPEEIADPVDPVIDRLQEIVIDINIEAGE